jgi:hypothetical protein
VNGATSPDIPTKRRPAPEVVAVFEHVQKRAAIPGIVGYRAMACDVAAYRTTFSPVLTLKY